MSPETMALIIELGAPALLILIVAGYFLLLLQRAVRRISAIALLLKDIQANCEVIGRNIELGPVQITAALDRQTDAAAAYRSAILRAKGIPSK
jgi:hypothetical protein